MFSGGSDGQGVEVVGQDAPSGPGFLAVIALAAAAHAVAAFEVADASFGAGAVALPPALGASGAGCWRPEMKTRSGSRSSSCSLVGPTVKPPSSATYLGDSPRRVSAVTVCASSGSRRGCRAATRLAGSVRARRAWCSG